MRQLTGKPVNLGFYVVVVVIVAVVALMQQRTTPFAALSTDQPTSWQEMGVQVASETARLLSTLCTALLGALGLLMQLRRHSTKPRHIWSAFACVLCVGVSLYFGYVVHMHLLWMINNRTFDPGSDFFLYFSHVQFYALLTAGFFFADFAVHNLGGEN